MANPVIPATDTVNYVFQFPDMGAAGQDTVVGTYTAQEVLLYFALSGPPPNTVVPKSGYQPMISQPGPIIDALYNHPNLLFAIDLALPGRSQSAILKTTLSAAQMAIMMMVLANYGTIVTAGLT